MDRFVLDTSIVIDGKISRMLEAGEFDGCEMIIPVAVLDELQAQASLSREQGFLGLNEVKRIREMCSSRGIKLRFEGERPSMDDIRLARHGRIDSIIKDVAKSEGATLITADYVQALVAEAEGINVRHIQKEARVSLSFERYIDEQTMSLHMIENVGILAKRGRPGRFELVKVREEQCTRAELMSMIREISDAARLTHGANEISMNGAMVIQLGNYRIAITRPPFSDKLEITVVRPTVRLTLDDYRVSSRLMERLKSKAEGVLIAGPPGSGKSTLASSLAEFYMQQGKIVKTFESPRDLQVSDAVTQYAPLEGSFKKAAEILLLVRPDYTIFDEVRRSEDFEVFADMRLAGVGMVGVVHASSPLDAIQRFIGRVELGMIPHILDTIIFVSAGEIVKVYELSLTVRVPTGMVEQDLARPVIEVRDFEDGRLEYEIYTFGEENVIVPVNAGVGGDVYKDDGVRRLAEERILEVVRRFDKGAEVRITGSNSALVRVDRSAIPMLIGKSGSTVKELERMLGISIDVEPRIRSTGESLRFDISEQGNSIYIAFEDGVTNRSVDVYVDDQYLFSAMVGKKARIKVSKDSDVGKRLLQALLANSRIHVLVSQKR
ncbi:MAG: PINc/VapC family ATPase [Candidatus Nitrosocaldus sp.]|nr:PINc/VapC family ATPase [Candidatus Nitrosocaldus sp.]MDW8275123.1 PINc/VapC family ATPase [Candidatus Nitrosocaldus sp.]